jgi:hypothetical protein
MPSDHPMNDGGVMWRRFSHNTVRPSTMNGGPKLFTLNQYALQLGNFAGTI